MIQTYLKIDLGENTYIRTISGANVDLIRSWVSEKLNWKPTRCFLVCGIHDILEGETSSNILDSIGTVITELKNKNENMEINICQLVPTLRVNELEDIINYYNNQLLEWSTDNGVSVIKCELSFKLGTGEVDELCFHQEHEHSGVFSNRCGAVRLLESINKQCDHFNLCNDEEN